ncbi:hypothetical protein FKG94_26450 [Exilibacterium tricleocarpae]|uniref:Uncharacterized protein n=1 Tax=Exilibacterium tricleocarpae TaxID=2591008 RepID=A0A545SPV1_9GAMM|nr:hypothetical protein [Exilibacterium tricleocarpae]TQV67012.1 hypothetical protein FKG94_26450 [Exilibacterium tricleocarpae]
MVKKVWQGKTGAVICFGRCKIKYEELVKHIEKEHFVESDTSRTHSGTERYWVFEVNGTALAFRYHDLTEELYVGSNQEFDHPDEIAAQYIPVPFEKETGEMWK